MPVLGRFGSGFFGSRAELALASLNQMQTDSDFGMDVYRPAAATQQTTGSETCGAPGCNGGWMRPWKNRRRPIFEDSWGCSGRCLEDLVRLAVRREVGEGHATSGEAHRHRVPLGLVFLAQGWITHAQLQSALQAQKASGEGRIGEWLAQSYGLSDDRITRGVALQWNCPVLSLDGFSPVGMARVMPKRFVAEFGLVPIRVAGSAILYLAFEEKMNAATALAVEQMSHLKVESGLLSGTQFAQARSSILTADGIPVTLNQFADADALTRGIVTALEQHQPLGARLVRVHHYFWLRLWLESGARSGAGNIPPTSEDVQDYVFTIARC
jgi:hypothetical protein